VVRDAEQLPVQGVAPVHAVRPVWGAPLTCEHVPSTVATSQASHCPVQARLQQYVSTQCAFVHWLSAPHFWPFGFFGWH